MITLLSDAAAGTVPETATRGVVGKLVSVHIIPDTGATKPSDNFDIVIKNQHSIELINDLNVDADANSALAITTVNGRDNIDGPLYISAANMGNSKGAKLALILTA